MWRELSSYHEWMASTRKAPSTRRLRRYQLARFAASHPDPWAVTLDDVEHWIGQRGSEETQQSELSALRGFYGWATRHRMTPTGWRDPTMDVPPIEIPSTRVRACPVEAFWAAEREADEDEGLMLLLAAHGGLRCAEIAAVSSRDLNVSTAMLRVRGKGRRTRLVPLSPVLLQLLAARPPGWVFPGRKRGTHLTAGTVSARLGRLLPDGYTAHSLRHAAGTQAYLSTKDIVAVQEFLGHSSPTTTRRYIEAASDQLLDAAAGAAGRMPSRRRLRLIRNDDAQEDGGGPEDDEPDDAS
jgi:integrase/recombinase XerC